MISSLILDLAIITSGMEESDSTSHSTYNSCQVCTVCVHESNDLHTVEPVLGNHALY